MSLWYLSFVGEEGWRGACVIEASSLELALMMSHSIGVNPGGDVVTFDVSEAPFEFPQECRNKLLNKEDLERFWGPTESVDI